MIEFWRGTLNTNAQRCYNSILGRLQRGATEIQCGGIQSDDVFSAYTAITKDHPELFYLPSQSETSTQTLTARGFKKEDTTLIISNIYSPSDVSKCQNHIKTIINDLKKQTLNRSDYEKVIICVEHIVRNTTYAIDFTYNQNAASALCFGTSQCSGISRALKVLLDSLGVFCLFVDGDGINDNNEYEKHAWNIVRCAGKFYHIDATYMLGCNKSKKEPLFRKYLFYDDSLIAQDHKWDKTWVPACTDSTKALTGDIKTDNSEQSKAKRAQRNKANRYESLSQLRASLTEAIQRKEPKHEFFIDIQSQSNTELCRIIKNACSMVFARLNVSCKIGISVESDGFVVLTLNY
ncbi:MAG: hypothetical protein IJ398_03090 [Clostridia bacterium]|nr:hypothetical protein [Clostridia bacterium]